MDILQYLYPHSALHSVMRFFLIRTIIRTANTPHDAVTTSRMEPAKIRSRTASRERLQIGIIIDDVQLIGECRKP